jgi:hypothetical protein
MYMKNRNLNLNSKDNPLIVEFLGYTNQCTPINNLVIYVSYYMRYNLLIDDQGWFLPAEKRYLYLNTKKIKISAEGYRMGIAIDDQAKDFTVISRTYKKLPNTIAHVLAMSSLTVILCKIVYGLLIDYFFMKYYLKEFLERVNMSQFKEKLRKRLAKKSKKI